MARYTDIPIKSIKHAWSLILEDPKTSKKEVALKLNVSIFRSSTGEQQKLQVFLKMSQTLWRFVVITTPKFNSPLKWWLEDYFPIGKVAFQGLC